MSFWAAMVFEWENEELHFILSGDHFETGFLVELVESQLELAGHLTPLFPHFSI